MSDDNSTTTTTTTKKNDRPVPFFWTLPSAHAAAIAERIASSNNKNNGNNDSLIIDHCRTIADLVWEYHAPPQLFQILNFVKATAPELAAEEEKQEEVAHLVWNFDKQCELKDSVEDEAEGYMEEVRDSLVDNELNDSWMWATMANLSDQFCKQGSTLYQEIMDSVKPSMSLKERNEVFQKSVAAHMNSQRFAAAAEIIFLTMEKKKKELTNEYKSDSLCLLKGGDWNGLVSLQAMYKAKYEELNMLGCCPEWFIDFELECDDDHYWNDRVYEEDEIDDNLPALSDDENSDMEDEEDSALESESVASATLADQETIAWLQSKLRIELFMVGQVVDDLYRKHDLHFVGLHRRIGQIHKKVLGELMQKTTKCTCADCDNELLVDSLHVVEEEDGSFFLVGESGKESKDVQDFGNALADAFSSGKGLW